MNSDQSQKLRHLAQQIASHLPDDLCDSIALVGSASIGTADAESDIDLMVWDGELHNADVCTDWFKALGAQELDFLREEHPGGRHFAYTYKDTIVEIDWETWGNLDRALDAVNDLIESDDISQPEHISMHPWMLTNLIVLKNGSLQQRIDQYKTYRKDYGARLISSTVTDLRREGQFSLKGLISRGELLAVRQQQIKDLHRISRLLFAINEAWEPASKWMLSELRRLKKTPPDLSAKINALLFGTDAKESMKIHVNLICDVLALLGDRKDSQRLLTKYREANIGVFE